MSAQSPIIFDQPMNRDILVLSSSAQLNPQLREQEMVQLHQLLFDTENWTAFSIANEIIDINRRRIIRKTHLIQQILTERRQKPFVFTCNKN